jgi:hypothetical protein
MEDLAASRLSPCLSQRARAAPPMESLRPQFGVAAIIRQLVNLLFNETRLSFGGMT